MMQKVLAAIGIVGLGLLLSSCASVPVKDGGDLVLPVAHQQGGKVTCLVDCVEMVLDYYGVPVSTLAQGASYLPASLVLMDSLLNHLPAPDGDRLKAFVVQRTGEEVIEHVRRGRPMILVLPGEKNYYHSVVVAGVTAGGRALYVHDPVRKRGAWMSRDRLFDRWDKAGNVVLLIGLLGAENGGLYDNAKRLAG